MQNIRLAIPQYRQERDALEFAEEVIAADGDGIHGSSELYTTRSYSQWLENINKSAQGIRLPNLSPADTYFAVRISDEAIVGIINIRHSLDSEFMKNYGGHIGYTVRPCERRKGYAKQMLTLALRRCRELGIERVLLTCDPLNTASCRTVEVCGGVMENEIPFEGTDELVRRYLIELS